MTLRVELEREEDGRWLAEVVNIPGMSGVIAYGETREKALNEAKALALRVLADQYEHGEASDEIIPLSFVAA